MSEHINASEDHAVWTSWRSRQGTVACQPADGSHRARAGSGGGGGRTSKFLGWSRLGTACVGRNVSANKSPSYIEAAPGYSKLICDSPLRLFLGSRWDRSGTGVLLWFATSFACAAVRSFRSAICRGYGSDSTLVDVAVGRRSACHSLIGGRAWPFSSLAHGPISIF